MLLVTPIRGGGKLKKKGFETLDETIEYVKQCQSNGYVTRVSSKFCKTERETIESWNRRVKDDKM